MAIQDRIGRALAQIEAREGLWGGYRPYGVPGAPGAADDGGVP
jgi:hypothetical protein